MPSITSGHLLFLRASTNGDGTGIANANYNMSGGVNFKVVPPVGVKYSIGQFVVQIQDAKNTFDVDKYGGLVAPLSVGIEVTVNDGSGILYYLTSHIVTANGHWAHQTGESTLFDFGNGDELFIGRIVFNHGQTLMLDGNNGEYLNVALGDDFTGITSQEFEVHGHIMY